MTDNCVEKAIDLYLGKKLRRRRRLIGMTQNELAVKVGVRFQQIQKYECGANKISAARLWRIAEALDVPPNYFYQGIENGTHSDEEVDESFSRKVSHEEMSEMAAAYKSLDSDIRRHLLGLIESLSRKNSV